MPYPSPADEERNGGCGPILAAVVLLFIVLAAASCASLPPMSRVIFSTLAAM